MRWCNILEICQFDEKINQVLGTNIPKGIIYRAEGLRKHLEKNNNSDCIPYIEKLEEMIKTAEYVGQSKNNGNDSFELIKIYDENILVAIKFDRKDCHLYVASIYSIKQSKMNRRVNSGRLKKLK